MKHKKNKLSRKKSQGYALVSIMVISTFAMVFLLGLSTIFLSISRAEAIQNQKNLLVQAMDVGLDYSLLYLNNNHPNTVFSTPQEFDLPADNLPTLNPPVTVRIRLTQLKNYSGGLSWDSVKEFSALNTIIESAPAPNVYSLEKRQDYWILCELTASRGVFTRSARAILEPQTTPPSGIDYTGAGSVPPNTSLFPSALFANSSLNFSPASAVTVGKANPSLPDLSLKSNVSTNIASGTTINGDLATNTLTGSISSPPVIDGDLSTSSGTPPSDVNVTGNVDGSFATESISPSPSMSVGSQIEFPINSTVGLGSSSYSTSTLNLDGSNTVNLPSSPTAPTKIFVDPNSSSNLNINSNSISPGGDPVNFQVFYNGNRDLTVTVSNRPFNGLIYAPNATVKIVGNGDFNGAVVGNIVDVQNNGLINLRTDVSTMGTSFGQRNINYGLAYGKNGNDIAYFGYQAITWQEVSNKLVP